MNRFPDPAVWRPSLRIQRLSFPLLSGFLPSSMPNPFLPSRMIGVTNQALLSPRSIMSQARPDSHFIFLQVTPRLLPCALFTTGRLIHYIKRITLYLGQCQEAISTDAVECPEDGRHRQASALNQQVVPQPRSNIARMTAQPLLGSLLRQNANLTSLG